MRRWLAALVARGLLSAAFSCFSILTWSQAAFAERQSAPLFLSASNTQQQGFVRVVNRSDQSGTATILAIDDSGGQVSVGFVLEAKATKHFNSQDLEMGNADKGLSRGIGDGQGDWRLEIESDLDIEALTYMRTADGFLTSLHDLVPEADGHHRVAIFNPGSNRAQESRLRLINPGTEDAEVAIAGLDDSGTAAADQVRVLVPAGEAHTITASQLESGHGSFTGRFGDGAGKWQLSISASAPIQAMSLLGSPTGHLTNLSTAAEGLVRRNEVTSSTTHAVPLFMSASNPLQQGFVRVVNRSDRSGEVVVHAIDDSGQRFEPVSFVLNAGATKHFNSDDLEMGNPDKGLVRGVGGGQGDWRLEVESALDIEVLAYMRTADGFLTSLHDLVAEADGHHRVAMFNPGSNRAQESRLRLINPGTEDAKVAIRGLDDQGWAAPAGEACILVPAGETRTIAASQLEAGHRDFAGRLGDGAGKWQLLLSASAPIQAMSLLESPTGHLTNLSTSTAGGLGAFTATGLEGLNCEAAGAAALVEIPDANLRAAVETALGKAPGEVISVAEMAWLNEIDGSYENIADLTGLEHAINLTRLDLTNNDISDLSPLSGLVNLETIHLAENNISDVSPLLRLMASWRDLSVVNGRPYWSHRSIDLKENPLSESSVNELIAILGDFRYQGVSFSAMEMTDDTPVDIPDANLRARIRSALNLPQDPPRMITVGKLAKLVHLDIYTDIEDLTGLDHATNLTQLAIDASSDQSKLADLLQQLSGLSSLKYLRLKRGGWSDCQGALPSLPNLPSLRTLDLTDCGLVSLPSLSGLTGLRNLFLLHTGGSGQLADLSPLSDLTSLRTLNLSGNNFELVDLSPLSSLTGLESLFLSRSRVADLPPLSGLTGLAHLDLSNNDISDLTPLSGLTRLAHLNLFGNDISDLTPLSGLAGLEVLNLEWNPIEDEDLSPLSSLTGLAHLDLSQNGFLDLSPLSGMTGLRHLDLSGTYIADMSPLSSLTGLEVLNLNGNAIEDLSLLSSLADLAHLDLSGNDISDLSPLSGLTRLAHLNLHGNDISDLTPLLGLTGLRDLDLSENHIEDLSPLSSLTGLTHLNLSDNSIEDLSPLSRLTSLEGLDLSGNGLRDAALYSLSGLTSLRGLNLGGNLLTDLEALPKLGSLVSLNLGGNFIIDLTPLLTYPGIIPGVVISFYGSERFVSSRDYQVAADIEARWHSQCCLQYPQIHLPPIDRSARLSGRFRAAVATALGKEPGDHISVRDMGTLVRLEVPMPETEDHGFSIEGIQFADRLTHFIARHQYWSGPHPQSVAMAKLSQLTHLDFGGNQISDIGWLPDLPNLTYLDLGWVDDRSSNAYEFILDVSSLSGLRNLTYLDLGGQLISDLSPLSSLTSLTYLNLQRRPTDSIIPPWRLYGRCEHDNRGFCDVDERAYGLYFGLWDRDDLSPLSGMTDLTYLDLSGNFITDLSPLSGMTHLTTLHLPDNLIMDLSPLSRMTDLTTLDLSNNDFIADLSPLSGMTGLTSLGLQGNSHISDLSPLSGMTGLTSLNLPGGAISDLSPLSGMTGLRSLNLNGNLIVDLSPLSGMTGLRSLNLNGNLIVDLSPVSGMTGLRSLDLGGNDVSDLSPLSGMTGLTSLNLPGGAISDLSPLSGMTGLRSLNLNGNLIVDLSPVSGMAGLRSLDLGGNDVSDLSPLSGMTGLTSLDLPGGAISDLSPLSGMTGLRSLNLNGNLIVDLSPVSGMAGLRSLDLGGNDVSDLSPLSGMTGLRSLDLSGNDISDVSPLSILAENAVVHDSVTIDLRANPLDEYSRNTAVRILQNLGFNVRFDTMVTGSNAEFPYSMLAQIYNDNVLVMHYSKHLGYSKGFYRWFEDVFDYLFIIPYDLRPTEIGLPEGAGGSYESYSNTTRGIGRRTFYNAASGSAGKLKGIIRMTAFGYGVALHELMHTWANGAITEYTGRTPHWGITSADGWLGGFDLANLQNLGDGLYEAQDGGTHGGDGLGKLGPYSPIELYFAGYIPAEEVPNLWVGLSKGWSTPDHTFGTFAVRKVIDLSIEDIIAKVGVRVPDVSTAQKHYRAAVILVTESPMSIPAEVLQHLSETISNFSYAGADDNPGYYNYFEATGGRGTITMDGLSQFRKATPGLPALPASFGKPPPPLYCPQTHDQVAGFTHHHSVEHGVHLHELLSRTTAQPKHHGAGTEADDGRLGELRERLQAHADSDVSEPEPSRRP